jgi:beta-lactamase class A
MLKKKISLLYCILGAVSGSVLTLIIVTIVNNCKANNNEKGDNKQDTTGEAYNIKRFSSTYKYISPIISVEPVNESEKFAIIKEEISSYILKEKQKDSLLSVSLYFREFSKGEWFSINQSGRYYPGSLVKTGVLMTYLIMAENDQNLLNKEVVYQGWKGFKFPDEHYQSDTVVEGQKYKIKQLLEYMIKYSDNRATLFLVNHMDTVIFKKEFTDLGIPVPHLTDFSFTLNVKEYSMILMALYNAGYLRKRASEDALSLLTESVFKDGLLKELPVSVVVAHKYGESGNGVIHELHESGIVYLQNKSYLITIMTRGTNWNVLSDAIGHISHLVYDHEVIAKEQ